MKVDGVFCEFVRIWRLQILWNKQRKFNIELRFTLKNSFKLSNFEISQRIFSNFHSDWTFLSFEYQKNDFVMVRKLWYSKWISNCLSMLSFKSIISWTKQIRQKYLSKCISVSIKRVERFFSGNFLLRFKLLWVVLANYGKRCLAFKWRWQWFIYIFKKRFEKFNQRHLSEASCILAWNIV